MHYTMDDHMDQNEFNGLGFSRLQSQKYQREKNTISAFDLGFTYNKCTPSLAIEKKKT